MVAQRWKRNHHKANYNCKQPSWTKQLGIDVKKKKNKFYRQRKFLRTCRTFENPYVHLHLVATGKWPLQPAGVTAKGQRDWTCNSIFGRKVVTLNSEIGLPPTYEVLHNTRWQVSKEVLCSKEL